MMDDLVESMNNCDRMQCDPTYIKILFPEPAMRGRDQVYREADIRNARFP